MSVKELFKKAGDEPIIINSIAIDEASVTLKTNARGFTNYDIAKENNKIASAEAERSTNGFAFDIEDYSITNSALAYIDEVSKTDIHTY